MIPFDGLLDFIVRTRCNVKGLERFCLKKVFIQILRGEITTHPSVLLLWMPQLLLKDLVQ